MQYNVPQFVEVEDKIIGPLTLKQFLTLLGGGLILFMLWSIFKGGVAFFVIALPLGAVFAYFAFGTFNGRPVFSSIPALIKFFASPKQRIFMRGADLSTITMAKKKEVKQEKKDEGLQTAGEESRKSRLKRLAYLLDQKTAEEERLIHSGQIDKTWLNKI